jgi:hypothetical protein
VIDVSAHGVDRRQRAEPRKYVRAANIPGMDDGIAAGKCHERLRPQQAMGIGNRANGSHHARPDYKRSRVRRERVGKSKSSREGSVEGNTRRELV